MVSFRQNFVANKVNSIVCDVVVLQVVLGQLFVRKHAELKLLQNFRFVVELTIASTDFLYALRAGKAFKKLAEADVFYWVATHIKLLKRAGLVNANLEQAFSGFFVNPAVGERDRLKLFILTDAFGQVREALATDRVVVQLQHEESELILVVKRLRNHFTAHFGDVGIEDLQDYY